MSASAVPVPSATSARRVTPAEAACILAERDPVIAQQLAEGGAPSFPKPVETNFAALVRSVVYQQLAGAAARAIHGRLVAALVDVTPQNVLQTPPEALRAVGLSWRKVESLLDLASKVEDGTVPLDARGLARESDDAMITRLSTVRGIGPWSAQMFLMFQLRRLDIWPTGDLAIRKGYGLAWGIPTPTPKELLALGEPYRPYRSVLAWYCWRAAELHAGTGPSAVTGGPVTPA